MNYITLAIAVFVTYLCVYALLARICQCIEHCATARSFKRFMETQQLKAEAEKAVTEFLGETKKSEPEEKEE